MKRCAILIASPGEPGGGADGSVVDVEVWREYLTDFSGGAWDNEEIHTVPNPNNDELQSALAKADGCDYAIVTFSGHGRLGIVANEPTTMLRTNDSEPARPYFELRPRATRTLMVIDSCRWAPADMVRKTAAARRIVLMEKAVRNAYRTFFEKQVLGTERGVITLFGCGFGEEARDWYTETQLGGLYTMALLKGAKAWCSAAASRQVLDVVQAHNNAKKDVTQRNPEQNPEVRHGRRLGVFPLAIKL